MDAAALIVRCRRRAGLSQRELAARSATSAAAICLHERGERIPRVDTLARIVAAAGGMLELRVTWPTTTIDVEANARALEAVLDLADHLPSRSERDLRFPIVRDVAGPSTPPPEAPPFRDLAQP